MNRLFLHLLAFLLAANVCFAVQPYTPVHPDPVLESWRWRTFPEVSGLGLRCLAEDSDGNIWFGVQDGAVRYDGITWTSYSEADGIVGSPVNQLYGSRDGSVYAGTDRGISRFYDGVWTHVFPQSGDLPWHVWDLTETSDGSLWAGTEWGAVRIGRDGATLYTTAYLAEALASILPEVRFVAVDDRGTLSDLASDGPGLIVSPPPNERWFGRSYGVILWVAPGSPAEEAGLSVGERIVSVDGDRDVSQGHLDGPPGTSVALQVLRKEDNEPALLEISRASTDHVPPSFRIHDILEGRDGEMWFAHLSGEVTRWNGGENSRAAWRLYADADGLVTGYAPRLMQALDGTLWMTTTRSDRGVSRFDGSSWSHFSFRDEPYAMLTPAGTPGRDLHTSILETRDGSLWIGGYVPSLYALRNGVWKAFDLENLSLPWHRLRLLEVSDGSLWIAGLRQGAARLDLRSDRWASYSGLHYGGETEVGGQWFLTGEGDIVERRPDGSGAGWFRYDHRDGLMQKARGLLVDRGGDVWAAGSHEGEAATARFDGTAWVLHHHPGVTDGLWRGYVASDGSVWFGSTGRGRQTHAGGLLRHRAGEWTHYRPPEAPAHYIYGITEMPDHSIWFGGTFGLRRFDGEAWSREDRIDDVASYVFAMMATAEGDLWVGSQASDVFRFDGKSWTRFGVAEGLAGSGVLAIEQTTDGSIWAATQSGVSRYDGQSWMTHALPEALAEHLIVEVRESSDGAIWINYGRPWRPPIWTTRYVPDRRPPDTRIELASGEVSQPGNATLSWSGADPWKATPDAELQFAYRLDDGDWSAYSKRTHQTLLALSPGEHAFEVRVRDRDFNVDPTPAVVTFTVLPPVWQQGWFIGMVVLFVGGIGWQTGRVIRRDRRLRSANEALSDANKELFKVNVDLQREQVLERLRGQAQGMQSSDDIGPVVEAVYKELSQLGLSLHLCAIAKYLSSDPRESWPIEKWVTSKDGSIEPRRVAQAPPDHPVRLALQRGEAYHHRHETGEEFHARIRKAVAAGDRDYSSWSGVSEDQWPVEGHTYYVFFEGGDIMLGSPKLISEDHLAIVRRFGEVFGYAHSRYEELQAKEAQNRELRNQNVLERLRGQAQGMQSSEDIGGVVEAVYSELTQLGARLTWSGISVTLSEQTIEVWTVTEDGRALDPFTVERPQANDALDDVDRWIGRMWASEDAYRHLTEGAVVDHIRNIVARGNPRWRDVPEDHWPPELHNYLIAFDGGHFSVASERPIQDAFLELYRRFGEVFGYAHSRYRELQEKEAQNEELRNQNVLERLRGMAQGMQSSDDIGPVVEAVYRELSSLGVPLIDASIGIDVSETDTESWHVDENGKALSPHVYAMTAGRVGSIRTAGDRGEPYYASPLWEGEELRQSIRTSIENGNPRWVGVPETRWPDRMINYRVFFEGGRVGISLEEPTTEETLMLIKRFGEVFAFAHSRYLELQAKEAQNRRLAVDAAVQRLRAEVQSMDEAGDFERILSFLTESLEQVELPFTGCEIDVLDEPVESPTMEQFEKDGFRYTTYTLAPDGTVASNAYALNAPFPTVNKRAIQRFIAGQPWQGSSDDLRIVEVPAGSYGRLRLTASHREAYTDDEIATLREFADAIALGYARYLDIREIQAQTERKSAFLAAMAHELRTPMNAIKGFTNRVLRAAGELLPDRQQENLRKVDRASDHLLAMINDLLDLSKIEAGRMDVNAATFDVGEVVTSSCDTISPLVPEGVALRQEVAADVDTAHTDRARVQQMLINLLSNAVKFTEEGEIVVTASREGENGETLRLTVSDTGKGIPEDELPTLFDEYRQVAGQSESTVQKGTGLGLSITKKFAELLGGAIGVESEVGKGTTFEVKIPARFPTGDAAEIGE